MMRILVLFAAVAIFEGCSSNTNQNANPASQPAPSLGGTSVAQHEPVVNSSPSPAPSPASTAPTIDDANAILVAIKDLGIGLDLGEKYPTQTLEITGTISSIDAISETASSITFPSEDFTPLICAIQEPQIWARLAPGQTVTLHGTKGTVPGTLYSFVWKVLKADVNPCPIISSKQLTEEFERDGEEAHKKRNSTWFYLTGKVSGITMQEFDNCTVTMEGAPGWTIELPINHTYVEIVKSIKTGDSIASLCQYESYDFKATDRKISMLGRPITETFPVPGVSYGPTSAGAQKP